MDDMTPTKTDGQEGPMTTIFCVIYRTGGTDNFRWHRTLGMTQAQADQSAAEIMRGGRPAFVERIDRSEAIGLPETFSGSILIGGGA